MTVDLLSQPLSHVSVSLELMEDTHLNGIGAACALDPKIWDIYPINMMGDDFDESINAFRSDPNWVNFAVRNLDADGAIVGMTNYINVQPENGVVEIGGTFIAPSVRGGGFNAIMKKLLIDHAFACGYQKIEFRVDSRNKRSAAAVLKLGAKHEGTLRKNRVTWTGYLRDTMVFGLLKEEWQLQGGTQ